METCFFLPGLGGSALALDVAQKQPFWVDYSQLLLGNIGFARLAGDGMAPGPPDGRQLFVGAPLIDYYLAAYSILGRQLAPVGVDVVPWSYDWRLGVISSGVRFAAAIRAAATRSNPCSVVAHSMGGLVARVAWSQLVATGDTGLVRRIVTLGTPHQGSYGIVALWSADSSQLFQVALLGLLGTGIRAALNLPGPPALVSPSAIIAMTATWPALYDVLPLLGSEDSAGDPNRSALYGAGWPAALSISPRWLAESAGTFGPLMLSAASQPPAGVLTTVGGIGLETPEILLNPSLLGSPSAYSHTSNGDGAVTINSALVLESAQFITRCAHSDLPYYLAAGGQLATWVLDPRTAPAPPPPPAKIIDEFPVLLAGPPLTRPLTGVAAPVRSMADC